MKKSLIILVALYCALVPGQAGPKDSKTNYARDALRVN